MMLKDELQRLRRRKIFAQPRHYPGISLEELKKTTKISVKNFEKRRTCRTDISAANILGV
jgi:hypothetical protein